MQEAEGGAPWRWPGQWLRQESFWRDVGSRTLSAVFAAAIVYAFALAAGYVGRPDVLPLAISALGGLVLACWVQWYGRRLAKKPVSRVRNVLESPGFGILMVVWGVISILGVVAWSVTVFSG